MPPLPLLTGPRAALDAPPPIPRIHTLLDTATLVDEPGDYWAAGARVRPYPCAGVAYWPLQIDPAIQKTLTSSCPAATQVDAFTVYLAFTRGTIGRIDAEEQQRLVTVFAAAEAAGVEAAAWNGALAGVTGANPLGQAIGDAPVVAGGPYPAGRALAELERRALTRGVIHANPAIVSEWTRLGAVIEDGTRLRTPLGTWIACGAGYPSTLATGGGTSDKPYAVLTGQVAIRRTPQPFVLPDEDAEAVSRVDNTATIYVERDYLVISDLCQHAAVQIDLSL